ncbi:hypothetical protein TGRUB_434480, partial [Toxoplasma gondii RUB]
MMGLRKCMLAFGVAAALAAPALAADQETTFLQKDSDSAVTIAEEDPKVDPRFVSLFAGWFDVMCDLMYRKYMYNYGAYVPPPSQPPHHHHHHHHHPHSSES